MQRQGAGGHIHHFRYGARTQLEVDPNGRIRRQIDTRSHDLTKSRVLDFDAIIPRIQIGEHVEAAFIRRLREMEIGIRLGQADLNGGNDRLRAVGDRSE